jgi:hypothetical protein
MPNSRYEKYEKPVPPTDLNAEYMDARETAYVLKTSVRGIRDALKALGRPGTPGKPVVTDRATRADIFQLRHGAPQSIRRTHSSRSGRPRKTTASKATAPKPARAAA